MNESLLSPLDWEHYFSAEALALEELLSTGDIEYLNKSKIRVALENNILSWDQYKSWIIKNFDYPFLLNDLSKDEIARLQNKFIENKK